MLSAAIHMLFYMGIITLLVIPLGWYIAQVFATEPTIFKKTFVATESKFAKWCGISLQEEMDWKAYLSSMLWLNLIGMVLVYAVQRLQYFLPLNPQNLPGVNPQLAFNTAASFVSNTNWQAYAGETTMSYFTQMFALTSQQFISAATGVAFLIVFVRGLVRQQTTNLGNFWQDVMRTILFILLPLCVIFAIILVSQGVIQNLHSYIEASILDPHITSTQYLPMGPVASMVAIKMFGANGGGFFGVNAAHPFENPNLITNYLQLITIVLIPAALCYTFGILVKDKRQGLALLITAIAIFVPLALVSMHAEQQGNPLLETLNISNTGNMEGKEVRFGPLYSALWSAATTATANGSVNSMLDSAMPISGFIYLIYMQMGEIVFGGIGCGLYSMLLMVIISVFMGGLMVGRTPEYLGKHIEPFEIKMITFVVLVLTAILLIGSAYSCVTHFGLNTIKNPGAHGFSEILYAFTSMRNNNGSALAGINANTNFYNIIGGVVILIGRYWLMLGLLAVAGSMAQKKIVPSSLGTLPTHNVMFIILLISVIFIVGISSFLPALALGPLVEHLMLWKNP